MKLIIEYAGDIDDKETGTKTIEIEFDKDTDTEIKIGDEAVRIKTRTLPDFYIPRFDFTGGFKSKKDLKEDG